MSKKNVVPRQTKKNEYPRQTPNKAIVPHKVCIHYRAAAVGDT